MNRIEKVKALQAIAAGKLSIESLKPTKNFCFEEISTKPGIYLMDGKEYSVDQYFAFCESKKHTSGTIIVITKHQPSLIKSNLTLNLN